MTMMGTMESPMPMRYICQGRYSSPKPNTDMTPGVNMTKAMSASASSVTQLSTLLEKGPILKSECPERMLYACSDCESASTKKVAALQFSGPRSNPKRPMQ